MRILLAWITAAAIVAIAGQVQAQATYVSSDASSGFAASPISHTIPAGWAADDLVIVQLHTGIRTVSSVPSGWTLINSSTGIGTNMYAYWKILVSGDLGASQSWTLSAAPSNGRVVFHRFTGHNTTPIDTSATANDASSGTSHVNPTVTTTADNCLVCRLMTNGGQALTASSGDTGTQRYHDTAVTLSLWSSTKTPAGSTGSATYTTGASRQLGHLAIAIAPAASSSAVPQVIISQLLAPQRAWQRFVSLTPIALVQ